MCELTSLNPADLADTDIFRGFPIINHLTPHPTELGRLESGVADLQYRKGSLSKEVRKDSQ